MAQIYVTGLGARMDEGSLRRLLQGILLDSVETVSNLETGELAGYGVVRVADADADEALRRISAVEANGGGISGARMPVTLPGEMAVRDWLHRHAEKVLREIGMKTGHYVLDYGCGPGRIAIPCARVVGGSGKVFAMDTRASALERLSKAADEAGLANIRVIRQQAGSVNAGLESASLDVVLIYDVLHEIEDKPGLLAEVNRVLKPGGFLSVFPMHWGNAAALEFFRRQGTFRLRDEYRPPNCQSPSHVLNFVRVA